VTKPSQEGTTLPQSQQTEILGSGLLFNNSPQLQFSGLLNPIPQETTTAQLGTGGSSADRAIFDLSGPVDGKPGETLVAWILTLPEEQTFDRHGGFHIISQSRHDLVQDVNHYPNPVNNPLRRNIAYPAGDDNNAGNPSIGAATSSPCASPTQECLVVKFQSPGLGEHDSIGFSSSILSGDAPITNEDLCKAKITYIFSDGFVTTSNFGRCPPASLPLVASSWHPDPYVAPHIVKSDLLLADGGGFQGGCTEDDNNPGHCVPLDAADIDVTTEGGQLGLSCDGGATLNNPVTGTPTVPVVIKGPVITISGNQNCTYKYCEFLGGLTINGGHAYLQNCQVDGNLAMTSGTLTLTSSTYVKGNVQISDGSPVSMISNHFTIGPSANIHGNLTLQNLPDNEGGTVCGTTISGGLTANNNQSLIQIGEPVGQQNCLGNTIAGGLNCNGNADITGGGNMVSGKVSPSCASLVQ
jgi:cytoskeletal protein CcmA (bactofilin family)